jgi:hypothetical protein
VASRPISPRPPATAIGRDLPVEDAAVIEKVGAPIENPNPKVAAMGRVERALVRGPDPENAPQPAILSYLSDLLTTDFLQYAPPEINAFTRAAIHDARLGKWKTMRALAALLTPENPFSKDAWKEALADASAHMGYEVPPLSREDVDSLRALLTGPIADFVRERAMAGEPAPRTLDDFAKILASKELRARLVAAYEAQIGSGDEAAKDVKAALVVAGKVLEQLARHVDAFVIDRELLESIRDRDGRLVPAQLDALPPFARMLLEDPHLGPRTIASVENGSSVSVHVLRKTPRHILEGLNHFSAAAAGGGFLWIDEYVRSGRRLQITSGDVARKRIQIEKMASSLEEKIGERRRKLAVSSKIPPDSRTRIESALSIESAEARAIALKNLAAELEGGAQAEAFRFARLFERVAEFRAIDPRQVLLDLEGGLDKFEALRKDAVRVRIHGAGSTSDHGLRGAIESSMRLRDHAQRTLGRIVGHDYAVHASESAKKIVYGVAGMAALGAGVHHLFGDGAMHMVISVLEDVATDVGEVLTVTGQGVPLGDVLKGGRILGQLATLGGAAYVASTAHEFLEATGSGMVTTGFGGLLLGVGSCALTGYTSLYSFFLFRRIAKEMGREGKFDQEALTGRARLGLPAVARRALDAEFGPDAELTPDRLRALEAAFDAVHERAQGIPGGEALAKALAAQVPPPFSAAGLSAIQDAQDDVIRLVTSGIDYKEVLERIADDLAKALSAMLAHKALPFDRAEVTRAVRARILPLDEIKDIDEGHLAAAVEACLTDVVALATKGDPRAHELASELDAAKETLARVNLPGMLDSELSPELKKLALRAGLDQTVATPVRQMLLLGMLFCVGSLTAVGALVPALLLGKIGAGVMSVLASSESIVACVGLSLKQRAHERALKSIDEAIAAEARAARELAER